MPPWLLLADFEMTPDRYAIGALAGVIVFLFKIFLDDKRACQKKHEECEDKNEKLYGKVEVLREMLSNTGQPLSKERLELLANKKVDELRGTLPPPSTQPRLA